MQGGKAESEEDAGVRVVMLGTGLHRAALLVKSLQQHQLHVNIRGQACNKRCYFAETNTGLAQNPAELCCMIYGG